jgi:hypothetical protein
MYIWMNCVRFVLAVNASLVHSIEMNWGMGSKLLGF